MFNSCKIQNKYNRG